MSGLLQRNQREARRAARAGVDRRTKLAVVAAVALLHVAMIVLLVRALGVEGVASAVRSVTAFAVPLPPPPPPPPPPEPRASRPARAAPAAPKAVAKQIVAPRPKIDIRREANPAPPVASTGGASVSGAGSEGSGTGAGGSGAGTGGGGVVATKAIKIAGDIANARDYPREGRALREGASVVLALTVGVDGRVKSCTVIRPSPDPQADAITCRLATKRFRFRPATDRTGKPVDSVFGWRQSWFS